MTTRFPRASGILLHPTSLPGKYGIGDLGKSAFEFVDFLRSAAQTYWQILPLGPTGYGDSPYQCFSAFAGNTLLISPDELVREGLLTKSDLMDVPEFSDHTVDYGTVYSWKKKILSRAFDEFRHVTSVDLRGKFETFCQENHFWLDDYALYRSIKSEQGEKPWHNWPKLLKQRTDSAMDEATERLFASVQAEKFYQFLFFRQWASVKDYAHNSGIRIIGDIPIFVAHDSSDVWCNQHQFKLKPDGSPKVVAGVPPDYFSKTGQLWGNPIYDWDAMKREGYRWWVARMFSTLKMVDVVRVDHFRGFAASWEVPGGDKTAENGRWVEAAGEGFFKTLQSAIGQLPVIAEDLGVITPDVEELRDGFGFPGMRILQFAFGGGADNHDLPHNYVRNCVAYTGTHDNDTAVGWWLSQAGAGSTREAADISREREYSLRYLNSDGEGIHWDLIRAVWASVADTAIAPVQDLIGIGTEGRMNLPASTAGNWQWRLAADSITPEIVEKLKEITETYGRTSELYDAKST